MTEAAFLKYLNKQVEWYKKKYKLAEGKAFGMWLAAEYLELETTDAFEAVSVDGGNDKDVDLFFVDEESERIIIGQLKFNSKGRYKAPRRVIVRSRRPPVTRMPGLFRI